MHSPVVRVSVIGTCEVRLGRARVGPDSAVLFPLVLYLALRAGVRITRTELLEMLWMPPTRAEHRHSLRQLLYRIRRAGLDFDADGSEITIAPKGIAVDLAALHGPEWPSTVALANIPSQASILQTYQVRPTPAFGEWVDSVRADAGTQIRRAALRHIATGRREGRWPDVETAARLCLGTDPLNEEATLALAEATAMGGSKAEALRILDVYLWEIGELGKAIGLPARLLRRRISEQPQFRTQRTGEPPLIARADELAWLNGRLDLAALSVSCTAMLLGPPGIGKTAVARAFAAHAEMRGWRIVQSRQQPSDVDRPMSVFVELLPGLLKAEGAAGAAPESIAQLRRLVEHRDIEDDILANKSQEAEAVQARIRASSLDLIGAIAHEGPLIVVLEDLHWIDLPSIRLLAWLIEHTARLPVLWLLTARLESRFSTLREALPSDRVPSRTLEPLGVGDAAALFTAYAPRVEAGARVTQLAYAVTGGNPLFIREVAGHWMETGGDERLPSNLRALMRGRVARLTSSSQRVLHCCAVLGRFATVPRVTTVLQVSTVALLEAIEELDGLGLLGLGGEPGSLALHDLWQEELVATMGAAARALLHLRSGEVLETESAESRSASTVSEAARHLIAAGARDRAFRALFQASEYQLANGLSSDAVSTSRLAIDAATTADDHEAAASTYLRALHQVGDWQAILAASTTSAASEQTDVPAVKHSTSELLRIEAVWRAEGDAATCMSAALACVGSVASASHRLRAGLLAAQCAANQFDAAALIAVQNALRGIERHGDDDLGIGLATDVLIECEVGALHVAMERATELVTHARRRAEVSGLARALRYAAYPFRATGRWSEALSYTEEAFQVATRHQLAEDAAQAGDSCAASCLEMGDLDVAERWLRWSESWALKVSALYSRRSLDLLLASIRVRQGSPEASLALLNMSSCNTAPPSLREHLYVLDIQCRAYAALHETEKLRTATTDLCELLRLTRTSIRQDSYVESLVLGLRALGRNQEAEAYATDYRTSWRRDTSPLPDGLKPLE